MRIHERDERDLRAREDVGYDWRDMLEKLKFNRQMTLLSAISSALRNGCLSVAMLSQTPVQSRPRRGLLQAALDFNRYTDMFAKVGEAKPKPPAQPV